MVEEKLVQIYPLIFRLSREVLASKSSKRESRRDILRSHKQAVFFGDRRFGKIS